MLSLKSKTLIILPHLDDEFAITPLLKEMSKNKSNPIKLIYCSERIKSSYRNQKKRRLDNKRSLKLFGIDINQVIYLNDFLQVEDNFLYKKNLKVFNFLKKLLEEERFNQVFTLNFEGGHPDHDQLAIIISNLERLYKFKAFYFPAYNAGSNLFCPFSVLRPLKSQEDLSKHIQLKRFCWGLSIKVALTYSTERFAFLMLFPTLLFKTFFSKSISYFDQIDIFSVIWEKSLSYKRYNLPYSEIEKLIDSIK